MEGVGAGGWEDDTCFQMNSTKPTSFKMSFGGRADLVVKGFETILTSG